MVRLKVFGSGRVLLEDDKGAVIDEFIVPDPEKAQEVVMEYLQNKSKCPCGSGRSTKGCTCTG